MALPMPNFTLAPDIAMVLDGALKIPFEITALSLVAGFSGTWAGRWIAMRIGLLSNPNPIVKQHTVSIPYLGGLGIIAGLLASAPLWASAIPEDEGTALIIGALLFFILGVVDDARPLLPARKLLAQVAVATIVVLLASQPDLTPYVPLNDLLCVVWIVTLVNAANFTDVSDGYAASLSIFAFLGFALLGSGGPAIAMAAASAGFLVLNAPPARVFMGDAGGHVLGFMLATFSFARFDARHPAMSNVDCLLLSAPFLFELLFCTITRAWRGASIFRGSPDHVALRLMQAGFSKTGVMLCGALFAAGFTAAAMAFHAGGYPVQVAVCVIALAVLAGAWHWLLWHSVPPTQH